MPRRIQWGIAHPHTPTHGPIAGNTLPLFVQMALLKGVVGRRDPIGPKHNTTRFKKLFRFREFILYTFRFLDFLSKWLIFSWCFFLLIALSIFYIRTFGYYVNKKIAFHIQNKSCKEFYWCQQVIPFKSNLTLLVLKKSSIQGGPYQSFILWSVIMTRIMHVQKSL